MIIDNLPTSPLVDEKGNLNNSWRLWFNQLQTQLQNNLSNEGYKVPQQTTANITKLNTSKSIGALLYDSNLNVLKVNLNGTFKTVTTS